MQELMAEVQRKAERDEAMLSSMAASLRSGMGFSFNPIDMAELLEELRDEHVTHLISRKRTADMKAFPGKSVERSGMHSTKAFNNPGMDLRDWFAGQALQGILAGGFADTVPHDAVDDEAAFYAYKYADEMLAQRNK